MKLKHVSELVEMAAAAELEVPTDCASRNSSSRY